MPPVDTGNFTLNVVAPVVETDHAGQFWPDSNWKFDLTLSEGIAEFSMADGGGGYDRPTYHVLGPGGAVQTVGVAYYDFMESFRAPIGMAGVGCGPNLTYQHADGAWYYYPEDYTTREVAINFQGYRGDVKLLYNGRFVRDSITVDGTSNPSTVVPANNPITPWCDYSSLGVYMRGLMPATENTPVVAWLGNDEADINGQALIVAVNLRGVGATSVGKWVELEGSSSFERGPGYMIGQGQFCYDPGDSYVLLDTPMTRPSQAIILDAHAYLPYHFKEWKVDGTPIHEYNQGSHPSYVTYHGDKNPKITVDAKLDGGEGSGPRMTMITAVLEPGKALVVKAGADILDYHNSASELAGMGYLVTNLNHDGLTELEVLTAIPFNEVFAFNGHGPTIETGADENTDPKWGITEDEVSAHIGNASYKLLYIGSCESAGGQHASSFMQAFNADCYIGWIHLVTEWWGDNGFDADFWDLMAEGEYAQDAVDEAMDRNGLVEGGDDAYPVCTGNTQLVAK